MSEYAVVLRFGRVDSQAEILLQVRASFVPRVGERLTIGPALPRQLPDPGSVEVHEVVHGPIESAPPFQVGAPRVVIVVPDPGIEARRALRAEHEAQWQGWLVGMAVPEDAEPAENRQGRTNMRLDVSSGHER